MKMTNKVFQCLVLFFVLTALPMQVFAFDSTSFDPSNVSIRAVSDVPIGTVITWPIDSNVPTGYIPCNGQTIPPEVEYNELRSVLGKNTTPNYNSDYGFLRGSTSGAGSQVADSIKSHTVTIPDHSHTLSSAGKGNFNYTSVYGSSTTVNIPTGGSGGLCNLTTWEVADDGPYNHKTTSFMVGSKEECMRSCIDNCNYSFSSAGGGSSGTTTVNIPTSQPYTASGSASLVGTTDKVSQTGTYTGGSETAPKHTKVQYLIKAR